MPDSPTSPTGFPAGLPPVAGPPDAMAQAHQLREQRAPLAHRLAHVAGAVARLPKTKTAPAGGGGSFKYTPIEDMAAAITGLCAAAGVAMLPEHVEALAEGADYRDEKRARWRYLYRVTWLVTDGTEQLRMQTMGEAMDWGDKGSNKALTGARKYLYQLLFHLQTGDDPDAEHGAVPPAEQGERPAQQARRQAARQRQAPASAPQAPQGAPQGSGGTQGTPAPAQAATGPDSHPGGMSPDDARKARRRFAAVGAALGSLAGARQFLREQQPPVATMAALLDVPTWMRVCTAAGITPAQPLPEDPGALAIAAALATEAPAEPAAS